MISSLWLLPCGVGVIFLAVSWMIQRRSKGKLARCVQITSGTVIDYVYRSINGDGPRTWHPVFEYYVDGKMVRERSNVGSTKKTFSIGQRVTIHYNPDNGRDYYVEELQIEGVLSKIFLFVGLGAIALSILFLIYG